jgi:hypothetical protein
MAIRGETIGRAYVKILADGSGLDKSVRDALRDKNVRQTMISEGGDLGSEYYDSFQKGFLEKSKENKGILNKKLFESIHEGGGIFDAEGRSISDHLIKGIREQFSELHGEEIGERIGQEIQAGLERGTLQKSDLQAKFVRQQRQMVARAVDAIERDRRDQAKRDEDFIRKLAQAAEDSIRERAERVERFMRDMDEAIAENHRRTMARITADLKALDAFTRQTEKVRRQALKDTEQAMRDLDKQIEEDIKHVKDVGKAWTGINKEIDKFSSSVRQSQADRDRLRSSLDDTYRSMRRLGLTSRITDKDFRRLYRTVQDHRLRDGLRTVTGGIDALGDAVGASFGRGSRNDFVNFMGGLAKGLVSLVGLPVTLGEQFLNFGIKIGDAFVEAGGGVAGFASAIGEIAATVGPAVVALLGLVAILGLIFSALSLIAGSIIAIASSISFALVGALAPIAGLIAPLGVAVGVLAAAFLKMDKNEKKVLKNTFKPMKDELDDLGDAARKPIFDAITRNGENFQKMMEGWEPLFRRVGRVFGGFIDRIGDFGTSSEARRFRDFLNDTVPGDLRRLGTAFGNVFEGLLNVFEVLGRKGGPVDNFLDWLVKITDNFAEWSKTKDGRKDMRDFFQKASDSASSLWDFLKGVWDVLKKILFSDQAKGAGDSMLTKMGDNLSEWADSITQKDLEDFFDDVSDFADSMGELAKAIGKLAAALDSPEGRTVVTTLVKITGLAFEAAANGITNLSNAWSAAKFEPKPGMTGLISDEDLKKETEAPGEGAIGGFFSGLGSSMKDGWTSLFNDSSANGNDFWPDWLNQAVFGMGAAIRDLGGEIRDQWNKIDWGDLFQMPNLQGSFDLGGFTIDPAGWLGGIRDWMNSLPTTISEQWNKIDWGSIFQMPNLSGTFDLSGFDIDFGSLLDEIRNWFTGLPGQVAGMWNQINWGDIFDLSGIGITVPDISGIGKQMGKFKLSSVIDGRGLLDAITRPFKGHAPDALRSLGDFDLSKIVDWGGVGRAITHPFDGGAADALHSMGSFDLSKIIDISDVTSKVFGAFPSPSEIIDSIGDVSIKFLVDPVGTIDAVFGAFPSASEIVEHIGSIDLWPDVHWPDPPNWLSRLHLAAGGVFSSPTRALIGEAGPEAVVPLSRPLALVDPAVRELSAFAQGLSVPAVPSVERGRARVEVGGITVITPSEDPRAVAAETVNRIVAAAYF